MKKFLFLLFIIPFTSALFAAGGPTKELAFPPSLDTYNDGNMATLSDQLLNRIEYNTFNLVAMIIFLLAIIHAFLAGYFRKLSHIVEENHKKRINIEKYESGETIPVSFKAETLHFLGEVEAIFGIWLVPLMGAFLYYEGWAAFKEYLAFGVNYAEPIFVVVIMVLASTRPVMMYAEKCINVIANIFKGTITAYWLSILTIGPILGSFITEPAAMTICALLLAKKFYSYSPSKLLSYGTLGLLFVNISIGGTMTNFAAPPVLMVAGPWEWSSTFLFLNIGWKAIVSIVISNFFYYAFFRRQIAGLEKERRKIKTKDTTGEEPVPFGILIVHLLFLAWTVLNVHYPPLVVGGFLFFLAFAQATAHHQGSMSLKTPLLVGFFLAGLVTHGGLQGWWIEPTLSRLGEIPMFFGSIVLTAFNDNAAITYLSTLVPNLGPELKYAVVTDAVTGGGLTVIANAPNPAGQAILSKFFDNAVNPLFLFLGALVATAIASCSFLIFM